jgi:hypothetical protein
LRCAAWSKISATSIPQLELQREHEVDLEWYRDHGID